VRWLGRMDYAHALALQEKIVAQKRDDGALQDELLLLEHEPVYKIGRTPAYLAPRICRIRSFRSIAAVRRLIMGPGS